MRLQRAESAASYALERLQNLTQRHVLLRLSHDRLEENLLVRPYTVRDALFRLRDLTLDESDSTILPAADDLINLLAEYCQLQRAALYPVLDGKISDQAAALLGRTSPWISTMLYSAMPWISRCSLMCSRIPRMRPMWAAIWWPHR